jgi:NTP pyrophosphatase (non-canonical NTP hydrolase)
MLDRQLNNIRILTELVMKESERQISKWGVQDHHPEEWLMFLTEEVGELAAAVAEHKYRNGDIEDVLLESIQIATLALKIHEMYQFEPLR